MTKATNSAILFLLCFMIFIFCPFAFLLLIYLFFKIYLASLKQKHNIQLVWLTCELNTINLTGNSFFFSTLQFRIRAEIKKLKVAIWGKKNNCCLLSFTQQFTNGKRRLLISRSTVIFLFYPNLFREISKWTINFTKPAKQKRMIKEYKWGMKWYSNRVLYPSYCEYN